MAQEDSIHAAVKAYYTALAIGAKESCCSSTDSATGCGCAAPDASKVDDLYLGCGDAVGIAGLRPGQTVLDLGSGAGLDCFAAARLVGPEGHVIGVDMVPEMIARARQNAGKLGLEGDRVQFVQGRIEALPLEDASVDRVISNCVINLSPDKAAVFREAFRVLKPGGQLAVSDMVTIGQLAPDIRQDLELWAGCLAGAVDIREYVGLIEAAGFTAVRVIDGADAIGLQELPEEPGRVISARIVALKPPEDAQQGGSRAYFDAVAEEWDAMRSAFFSEDVRVAALRAAGVTAGQTAADVGAGSGFLTLGLLEAGLHVVAIDQSDRMLEVLAARVGDGKNVSIHRADGDALPLADGSVDHALANMYLHHVEEPATAIREMARIVRPGGSVVITDLDSHQHEFLMREHHDRWPGFARESIVKWFIGAGLTDVSVESVGSNCCATSSCGTDHAAVSIFVAAGRKLPAA